jgi:thymidylate synthase ThyX
MRKIMEDRQRIISLFVEKSEVEKNGFDVTDKLYQKIARDRVEAIKYVMPSATESGIYFTIVILEKTENAKQGMGF